MNNIVSLPVFYDLAKFGTQIAEGQYPRRRCQGLPVWSVKYHRTHHEATEYKAFHDPN